PIAAPDGEAARVEPDEIARVEIASLSDDLWPDHSASFMRVCLDAPNLRWLHTFSAGVDHPIFRLFLDRGVRLTNSSGAAARSIAHHVVLSVLAMRRDLPGTLRDQAAHDWRVHDVDDVEGTTVAVIGMGPIGIESARLLDQLGMRTIGMRRTIAGDEPCETWTFDRLHELLAIADTVVLAVPLTPDTQHLVDAAAIASMRPGVHLVNVGRGGLVDEPALVDALRTGRVGFAALDVTEVEPLPAESELWDLPNVIITPHSSGATRSNHQRASDLFVDNLGRFVRGEPLSNEVV
ncbi:MAG: D-2-hydroxyacid dehydrogenase, partial [Ilumatobacteraceae bacterium]